MKTKKPTDQEFRLLIGSLPEFLRDLDPKQVRILAPPRKDPRVPYLVVPSVFEQGIPVPRACYRNSTQTQFALAVLELMRLMPRLHLRRFSSQGGDEADLAATSTQQIEDASRVKLASEQIKELAVYLQFLLDSWPTLTCLRQDCGKPIGKKRLACGLHILCKECREYAWTMAKREKAKFSPDQIFRGVPISLCHGKTIRSVLLCAA